MLPQSTLEKPFCLCIDIYIYIYIYIYCRCESHGGKLCFQAAPHCERNHDETLSAHISVSLSLKLLGWDNIFQCPLNTNTFPKLGSHIAVLIEQPLATGFSNHHGFRCESLMKPLFQTCFVKQALKDFFNALPLYMRPSPNGGFKHPLSQEICDEKWQTLLQTSSPLVVNLIKHDRKLFWNRLCKCVRKDCLPTAISQHSDPSSCEVSWFYSRIPC